MSLSFPSRVVSILDVPEVRSFEAKFVYNFFTPDESVNDSVELPAAFKTFPAESFDAARIDEARRVIPRFVKFSFTRVMDTAGLVTNEFSLRTNQVNALQNLTIRQNLAEIQLESDFSGENFTGLDFQDDNIDRKLHAFVSGTVAKRVASKNRLINNDIDRSREVILENLTDQKSLLDAAKALATETTTAVSDNLIIKSLNQIDALKLKLIDDELQQEIVTDTFDKVKNVNIRAQISNRLLGKIVRNVVNDPMSIFADELVTVKQKSQTIENKAVNRVKASSIAAAEFDQSFKAVKTFNVDAHDFVPSVRTMGYIIDKNELLPGGGFKRHSPIIIENSDVGSAVDFNVAYGKTYVYTIRTIAEVKVRANVDGTDDIVLGAGLVSSRRSPRVNVECVENVPPPTIADFNIIWSHTRNVPLLTWSFPANRQRDIKRFQVFRRFSINEPFELLREFNFDDSIIQYPTFETVENSLKEKLLSPSTTFYDAEFRRTWRAIYAVCAIDAHGLSSNYSMQLEVAYDQLKNKLDKRIISYAGAPKAYPNVMLNSDTFVDSIKTSGHTRLRVVFDPEFLKVTDKQGSDLRLLSLNNVDGGKYRLQIINTDLMEQEVVDVLIDDMRPTGKK